MVQTVLGNLSEDHESDVWKPEIPFENVSLHLEQASTPWILNYFFAQKSHKFMANFLVCTKKKTWVVLSSIKTRSFTVTHAISREIK